MLLLVFIILIIVFMLLCSDVLFAVSAYTFLEKTECIE